MEADAWRRAAAIFEAALDVPEEEREAVVGRMVGGDRQLRRLVEELFTADREGEGFLEDPSDDWTGGSIGGRIGCYRLLKVLGQGGTSNVYLASRQDGREPGRVAVKVLSRLHPTDLRRRFRSERQILAGLQHPNIARLLDSGVTADGRPFLVMEWVDGIPIDRYCDQHRLSLDRRLRLFLDVCSAVEAAHRQLLVHRDLKPGNVLVTAAGQPKLLDFGIAKLLPSHVAGDTTTAGERMMTPQYASPEQIRGDPVSTVSDVYSLGVLLYKLLTGHLPYRLQWSASGQLHLGPLEGEPRPPSAVVGQVEQWLSAESGRTVAVTPEAVSRDRGSTPRQLRRHLRGDLDQIVLTALRPEPGRRYGSVEQLAEDLRRHLTGRPVRARPASFRYRARKFVRRNRTAVALTALVLLSAASAAAGLAWQARRVAAERDRAQQVVSFLEEVFETSDPAWPRGDQVTARELLDRAAGRLDNRLEKLPGQRGTLLATIGRVYRKLGLYERAEGTLREALTTLRSVDGPEHPELPRTLRELAAVLVATGDTQAGRELAHQALALERRSGGDRSAAVASTFEVLASAHLAEGDLEAAEELAREALEIFRERLGTADPRLIEPLNSLADILYERGGIDQAERFYREALEIARSSLPSDHPDLLLTLHNLGAVSYQEGDLAAAEERFREAVAGWRRSLGGTHPDVALGLQNLASVLVDQGRYGEAEPLLLEALEIWRESVGADSSEVAWVHHSLGVLHRRNGDLAAAESRLRQALALHRELLASGHPTTAYTLITLGRALLDRGDPRAAEPLLAEGVEAWRTALGPEDWRTAVGESLLGASLSRQGRFSEAEPLLVGSLQRLAALRGANDPQTLEARAWLEEHWRNEELQHSPGTETDGVERAVSEGSRPGDDVVELPPVEGASPRGPRPREPAAQ